MARLHDLPNELIDTILTRIWPEDLENFAQICKDIQALALPFLTKHRKLIRQHSYFKNDGPESLAGLLLNIITDPVLGHYVRTLDVGRIASIHSGGGRRKVMDATDYFRTCSHAPTYEKYLSLLNASDTSYDRLVDTMEDCPDDVMLALLIPHLPQLSEMKVPEAVLHHYFFLSLIQQVSKSQSSALSRLKTVFLIPTRINNFGRGPEDKELSGEIVSKAEIPSLRRLLVMNMPRYSLDRPLKPKFTNVSTLELWRCKVKLERISSFLKVFRLERFAYSCGIEYDDLKCFNPAPLLKALLASSKSTLKDLTCCASEQEVRPATMVGFEVLEQVYAEWRFILPGVVLDGTRDTDEWEARALPKSLRRLEIVDENGSHAVHYQKGIDLIVDAKTRGLVQVDKLCFTEHLNDVFCLEDLVTLENMTRQCEDVGITLEVNAKDPPYMQYLPRQRFEPPYVPSEFSSHS